MERSAKMTGFLLLKAYTEFGRHNCEVALITLSKDWQISIAETADLVEFLGIPTEAGCLLQKDHSVRFLFGNAGQVPFYENWFGENELTFIQTNQQEIERFCNCRGYIKSDFILVYADGMAYYEAYENMAYRTVKFDLKLILEILNTQN